MKELLEYVKRFPDSPVSSLKIRPLPRWVALGADTQLPFACDARAPFT